METRHEEGKQAVAADQQIPLSYAVDAMLGPVRLRYVAPPEHLRRYIGSLYLFTVDCDGFADMTRADVPQLRWMVDGGGAYTFRNGIVAATPEVCLLGPTLGATRFALHARTTVVGVSLLPAGWLAIHGDDASNVTDQLCDMGTVGGQAYVDCLERLRSAKDADEMVNAVWDFLGRRMKPLPESTWQFLTKVDAWLTGETSPQVGALIKESGLSARQVARLVKRLYGAPPKLLARKYRALRCSARIAIDQEDWRTLCDDGTFYDQSHFIREIKRFIGLTPHQLLTEPSAVAQLTLLRRSLGGDVAVINRLS